MKLSGIFFSCLLLALVLPSCSKQIDPTVSLLQRDPALQSALDELTRLESATRTGLNYRDYQDHLLRATENIDVAFRRSTDEQAKLRIKSAVNIYIEARNVWKNRVDAGEAPGPVLAEFWEQAASATDRATEYAHADQAVRERIEAREQVEVAVKADRAAMGENK